jgi:multiple sugar transport system substrate-binding protein
MNIGLLYYRSDLLDRYGLKPPGTWEELVAQVRRIRDGERDPRLEGFVWQGKQYEGMVVNVLEALWANGARLFGETGTIFPDRGQAEEALGFLRRLITSGVSPAWVTAADEELSRRAFGDGRAIFLRNWPYAKDLFELPGSAVRGKVGMAALPRHARGERGFGSTGGAHMAVDARTRHPEAAVALARFLTSAGAQRAMAAGVALNPTRLSLYDDPDVVRGHPHLPMVRALARAGRPRPVTPHYLMISTTLQPEFSAVLVGVKSPAQALAHAERRLRHLLAAAGERTP